MGVDLKPAGQFGQYLQCIRIKGVEGVALLGRAVLADTTCESEGLSHHDFPVRLAFAAAARAISA